MSAPNEQHPGSGPWALTDAPLSPMRSTDAATADPISQLEAAILALEAQRGILGDAAVDLALKALRQQLADLRQPAGPEPPLDGEYKLVTVMFADLSGFTALSERLGPERIRRLMNACFEALVPVVEKYEGAVEKFVGDAIMAVFGAPVAHENDPERALRTALEMQEALATFNRRQGMELGLHFGINTGQVVAGGIGSSGRQQYGVTGDAVNLASRLEDASEEGEILVGPDTYRLTAPLFEFEALPPLLVKGKAAPVAVYRLLGLKAEPGAVRGITGLRSPLVGREAELRRLQEALSRLREGRGGAIALVGEAGMGKSRQVAEARKALPEGIHWVEGRALSYTENISYWIARDVFHGLLRVSVEAAPEAVDAALRESVARRLPEQTAEVYPYLARLLELPLDPLSAERVQHLAPQALQQSIFRAAEQYVRAWAQSQPLVLVWEDLHWADPSSLQLLERLLPLTAGTPLLLLFVFRPEEGRVRTFHQNARAACGDQYQVIEVAPLTRDQSTQLLGNLLQVENVPAPTLQMILDKAEGNAFYLEEVLRSLIDAGLVVLQGDRAIAMQPIGEVHVPDTLQGVIMSRIDRLPPEDKRTLQSAAVIGRVFQQRVLAHLLKAEAADEQLEPSLAELRRRELIRLRSGGEGAREQSDLEYIFKHVVTQEVTYHSLLVARRKALHQVTAEAIEALFSDRLDELSATLGYHYERAEIPEKAVPCLARAGDRAWETYANEEAVAFYRRGLHQLGSLLERETAEPGPWHEVGVQLSECLGDVLELTAQHEEARAAYHSALRLVPAGDRIRQSRLYRKCGKTWEREQRLQEALHDHASAEAALGPEPPALDRDWWQEWIQIQLERMWIYYWQNQPGETYRLVEKIQPFLDQYGTPAQRAGLFHGLVTAGYRRDRFRPSGETLAHAQAAVQASEEAGNITDIIQTRFGLGFARFQRDEREEAENELQATLALAERIGDVIYQSMCLAYLALIRRQKGWVEATREYNARSRAAARVAQRPIYTGLADANQAWLAFKEGNMEEALRCGEAALAIWAGDLAKGFPFRWIALFPLLAAALAIGQDEAAVQYARELLAPTERPMPDDLAAVVQAAVQAWDEDRPDAALVRLRQAVERAKATGYL